MYTRHTLKKPPVYTYLCACCSLIASRSLLARQPARFHELYKRLKTVSNCGPSWCAHNAGMDRLFANERP